MVKIALQIKANLENIKSLRAQENYNYILKIKCTHCSEESDKWHYVNESETFPSKTAKSDVHFLIKCKLCGRENTLEIVPKTNGEYTSDDQDKLKTIVIFDCRGLEPIAFSPRDGWIAVAEESGKTLDDIDLTDGEWVEYDDISKQCVRIYDIQSQFIKQK